MTNPFETVFLAAFEAHQAGRVQEAEKGYRQVLSHDSRHADALHLLGLIYVRRGALSEAEVLIRQATGVRENAVYLTKESQTRVSDRGAMNTYRELLGRLNGLKREIERTREREAQLLAARVLEVLAENSVDMRDLLKSSPSDKRYARRFVPKYVNPATGATWSGRGCKPLWLIDQDLEKFLIADAKDRP